MTLRSVPTDESIDETMTFSWDSSAHAVRNQRTSSEEIAHRSRKRVTEVTRRPLAEEVGFEPTVPGDTAVFETARFGRSRTPPSRSLQRHFVVTFRRRHTESQ